RKMDKFWIFWVFGFWNYGTDAQNLTATTPKTVIKVGIAAAQKTQATSIGFNICGGALPLAEEYLRKNGFVGNFDFEYHVEYTECDLASTIRAGLYFMQNISVDVIIGPPCSEALRSMATLGTLYKKPVLGWGFVSQSDLADMTRFPYLVTVLPTSQTLGYATNRLLETYKWDKVALLYYKSDIDYCHGVMNDVEAALNDATLYSVQVVLKAELDVADNETSNAVMNSLKSRVRIVLWCAQLGGEKRDYMIRTAQLGLDNPEYVHVMLSMRSIGFGVQTFVGKTTFKESGLTPVWEAFSNVSDGLEPLAKQGATNMLVVDLSSDVKDKAYLQYMQKNMVSYTRSPPISCATLECTNATASGMGAYARHLFDVFYLYGIGLTRLNSTSSAVYDDMGKFIPNLVTSFDGLTGLVSINANLSRMPLYQVYGLDENYEQISLMNLTFNNGTTYISLNYKNESVDVWHFWNNMRPLATPLCGFLGKNCPIPFWDQYRVLIFVGAGLILLMITMNLICFYCMLKNRRDEQARINSEWQISYVKLRELEKQRKGTSKRSIQSGPSNITGDSRQSTGSEFCENYTVMMYEKDMVLTMKGSLQDILSRGNFSMDYFFMFCIIKDIAEGLNFLHKSFLRLHGNLRSATCLVNDSWQVKLAEFGTDNLLEEITPTKKRLMWAAPEVLRGSLTVSQMDPSADVYSFAIVASEILTKKEAWDLADRKETYDEILYIVKKGGSSPLRPDIITDVPDVNPALIALVKDCWAEDPEDRPNSENICVQLRDLMPKTKTNLMDHVFNMLEEYTSTLEVEVEERTKELTLEKKKADILLSRMLPRQVAERLKAGQTVEPEGFDSVTVFFSDVVKFTQLSQKCSPFQVVNLLNDLYSNFDTIIEEHGVYKVESIGDGYLCVSGLPTRNGYAHIKQIVDMSLQFMEYCRKFKIPHLPREQVELRIGVNSGPCVAGVVGLSMPRYCLFGDTVNTASRMESNGKASLIHLSAAAHSLLTTHYPHQYETNSRGEVIIKGKGVMETFWVLGAAGDVDVVSMSNRSTPPVTNERWGGGARAPEARSVSPEIRVGIAAAQTTQSGSIGWSSCGGAVPIAVQYLQQKGMLKDFDFEYIMEYTECDKASAVKAGLKFMKDLKVDVVIGPPCAKALEVMGTLSVIYQKLVLAWGFVSESQLADTSRFPYVTSVQPTAQTLGQATAKVLELYKWDRIALLYYSDEQNYCQSVVDDVEATLNDPDSFPVNIVWKGQLEYTNAAATRYTLNAVKSRARIILFCAIAGPEKRDYLIKIGQENMISNDYVHVLLTMRSIGYGVQSAVGKKTLILFCAISGPEKRDYLIKIAQENMTTNEYVHVLLTMRSIGYGVQTSVGKKTFKNGLTPLWESFSANPDGNESMAKKAAEKMLVIDINSDVQDAEFLQYFTKNAADAVRSPPMNCNSSACVNASSASMGSYARHLFDVFYLYGQAVDKLNTTDPNIYNDLDYLVPQLMTSFDGMTGRVQISKTLYRVPFYQLYGLDADYEQIPLINMTFFNASSTMSLGYSDENKSVWHFWGNQRPLDTPICGFSGRNCPIKFWDQYGVLIFVAGIVILFLVLIIIICAGWIVRNRKLEQERQNSEWQIPSIKLQIPEKRKTENSKRSINSGPSTVTGDSKMTGEGLYGFHENYTVLIYEKDLVLTTRHHGISLNSMEKEKYAKLRKLDHDNLNKFIGLSIDGPLWISGLNFLHKSFLRLHGNLRSATCLVNDSWQVKLAEFGMDDLLEEHTPTKRRLLWAAPEVLRGSLTVSQMDPSADVYSFAIVASEILTKREAWDFANRKEGADEILYMIKKGGARAVRPELIPDAEVSPSLCTLVKDCWSEVPEDRPKSEQICKLLFEMTPNNFDTIIEEHGVYKVESIGDGYLCVSGLPTRNGYAHIKQIVDMSLQFMEYCRKFKIPHLPREQVELRIGVNSGPCVAGVVGLSMPRYCLFGDTVNTASRMESNGKPSQIHMSEAAHSLLTSHYPHQYETSSRGEDMASMSTRTTPPVTDENWPPHFKDEQSKRAKTPYPERISSASHKNNDTLKVKY
ncbi:hypothetical protein L5515_013120, partial [Caenorhabditis briggsae]